MSDPGADGGNMTCCSFGDFGLFKFKANPELIPEGSDLDKFIKGCIGSIEDLEDEVLLVFDELSNRDKIKVE